jgi:hypothetical protein
VTYRVIAKEVLFLYLVFIWGQACNVAIMIRVISSPKLVHAGIEVPIKLEDYLKGFDVFRDKR